MCTVRAFYVALFLFNSWHVGDVGNASWLDVARPAIEERMSRYSASETHFALMSIGKMKSSLLQVGTGGW